VDGHALHREAHGHDNYKRKIAAIDDEGTVVTRAVSGKPNRQIRNAFDREWLDLGLPALPLAGVQYERVGKPAAIRAREEGDVEHGSAAAGQSAGLIRDVRPVAQVMASIVEEAEAILLKLGPKLRQTLGARSEA
jgi:enoyl-[acyl-carrier protein] reductase II